MALDSILLKLDKGLAYYPRKKKERQSISLQQTSYHYLVYLSFNKTNVGLEVGLGGVRGRLIVLRLWPIELYADVALFVWKN